MSTSNPEHLNLWLVLRRQLLLGTDQLVLSKEVIEALKTYNISEEEKPALLLEAVGTLHLLRKGASRLNSYEGEISAVDTSSSLPSCSWRSVQHLQAILEGHHTEALPEFAELLANHKKALPASSLPDLLNLCVETPAIWPLLQPLIGERGYWLLQQHPDWSKLAPDASLLENWMAEKGKDQILLLSLWRAKNAQAARESLEEQWPLLDYKAKAKLLASLSMALSIDDEGFLATVLQEKRKDTRVAAANLLTRLSGSDLVKQLSKIAVELFVLQQKKLHLRLPEALPSNTKSLGIYPTGSKQTGGLIVNWMSQIVARVPFEVWEEQWQKSAAELAPLFAQAAYSSVLLPALAESLGRFPNEKAQTALIRWWLLSGQELQWKSPAAKQLLQTASDEQFNDILLFYLQQAGPLIPADSMAAYWLGLGLHKWTAPLSKLVVYGFRDMAQSRRIAEWSLYHYKKILETAAYQSDAKLLAEFKTSLSFRSAGLGRWQADLEKLLQTLHFRLEMAKAMAG